MTTFTEEALAENLTFLASEVSKARLTVIVTGGTDENIALAAKLVEVLPGKQVEEYQGIPDGKAIVVVTHSLTSYLEQDASIILRLEASDKVQELTVTKNRSGKLGVIRLDLPAGSSK